MRNKYLIILFIVIGSFGVFWGYLKLNGKIKLNLSNQTQTDLTWQWSCNSGARSEPYVVKANSKAEVTIYPSCEGEIGITVSDKEKAHYEKLIGYVPTGKPEIVSINMSAFNQIEILKGK